MHYRQRNRGCENPLSPAAAGLVCWSSSLISPEEEEEEEEAEMWQDGAEQGGATGATRISDYPFPASPPARRPPALPGRARDEQLWETGA